MSRRSWLILTAAQAVSGASVVGCGSWSTAPGGKSHPWELKTPQMSPDSVVLEVAILRFPLEANPQPSVVKSADSHENQRTNAGPAPSGIEEIWSEVDEQFLPRAIEGRLAQNGFRCGLLDGRPGPALQSALDAHASRKTLQPDEVSSETPVGIQRLQNRAGRRGKVLTAELRESLAVLRPDAGRLHGKTYSQAQCLVAVRSFPRGDGQVDLELTPELEHGQAKPKWLGEAAEGSFRIDTSRERLEFDSLRITARVSPGQMLVLGPSPPWKGLGRQFFAETSRGTLEPRLLIVRIAQTQLDDLFAPEHDRAPLVSPAG